VAKRNRANNEELAAVLAPGDDQSCDDARTAALLDISLKTLQRLDAKKAGPKFFRVGSRKRRTLGAIRAWVQGQTENPSEAAA
jgi:hypothetical protein